MSNKKGLLLAEETLKIIIALIAISLLVYFLAKLYFNSVNSEKLLQAKETMERIEQVIDNSESVSEDVTEITPSGWYLFSFTELKPNSCFGQNCICICPNSFFNQQSKCDKKGICTPVPNIEAFEKIKILSPGISVTISKLNEKVNIVKK